MYEKVPIAILNTHLQTALVLAPILLVEGKLPGSAGILACVVSGNGRLTEAGRQGCLRSQGVCPTIFRGSNHISYFIWHMTYEIWRKPYDQNYAGR
jgi:hypothetical protein